MKSIMERIQQRESKVKQLKQQVDGFIDEVLALPFKSNIKADKLNYGEGLVGTRGVRIIEFVPCAKKGWKSVAFALTYRINSVECSVRFYYDSGGYGWSKPVAESIDEAREWCSIHLKPVLEVRS